MKREPARLYLVEWADAFGDPSWTTVDKARTLEPYQVITVGWLLKEDETKIVLSSDLAADGIGVAGVSVIPRDWVRNIYELTGF